MKDKSIEQIIRETTEENQSKTDWTKAWSTKYPILKTYQAEVDIPHYASDQGHAHRAAKHLRLQRAGRHACAEGHTGARIHG